MTRFLIACMAAAALLFVQTPAARAACSDPEFCGDAGSTDGPGGGGTFEPCWNVELGRDVCNEPPDPCPPEADPGFQFIDNLDGADDGQIFALNNDAGQVACGTLTVTKTGYYRIFDLELSESCDDQLDETGYLTVDNSCNPGGWALEGNVGDRYLVLDSDNTAECSGNDCGAGKVCREGNNHGTCCVPEDPTFMGTFLLVAGEDNRICLHHWCPEWLEAQADGQDLGFVTAGCEGINSIHFRVDVNAILCEDEDATYKPCAWGCESGQCLPDPCDAAGCANYCRDGVCLDEDPCAALSCAHGCKNGRCLQPPSSPGPDQDGDGFPSSSDCDDDNDEVHPRHDEICDNALDDDCDGSIDEAECQGGDGGSGSGAPGVEDSGCGCEVVHPGPTLFLGLLLLPALLLWRCSRGRRASR